MKFSSASTDPASSVKRIDAEEKKNQRRHHHSRHREGEGPPRARFLAVGPGGRDEGPASSSPSISQSGDRVLFGKWSGTEVKIDGEDLLIMKGERHHGAVIEEGVAKKKAA